MSVKKTDIVKKIAAHIIVSDGVSWDDIHERAMRKKWYTRKRFDTVMEAIARHTQISVSVKDDLTVIYKKKQKRKRKPVSMTHLAWPKNNYPPNDFPLSPFKLCFCAMNRTEDDEIWTPGMEHHEECDAVIYPDEFIKQNPLFYVNARR